MADDDRAVKGGQAPADPPAVEPSAQTFEQASPSHKPSSASASEWTASDERGPLGTADEAPLEPPPAETPETKEPDKPPHIVHEPSEHVVVEKAADGSTKTGEDSSEPQMRHAAYTPVGAEPKKPLWAVAVGIVIGAAIGAGSAAFVYRSVQGDVMSDEVTRLVARVDALEKRPAPSDGTTGLKQSVADLESKVAALSKTGDTASAQVDLAPLDAKIATLQSSFAALKAAATGTKSLDAKVASLESTLNGMKTQAQSAQAGVVAVQGEQKALAGKVTVPALAVVADSLVQQIDQGQPYAGQVDALAALGADPAKIAVLRQNAGAGVPSAKVLAAKFEPLAEPIILNPRPAPANAGFVERLKNGMFGLVSVRRADDTSGSDPASRVARIKLDLAHNDVAGALGAWDGLPETAKAKGEAWHALAKSHADAMNAARALQREAIAALGGKKS